MKELKMYFGAKIETFQIKYEETAYIFAECSTNPAARGFYTRKYIDEHTVK